MLIKKEKMPAFALHQLLETEHRCRRMSDQAPEDPSSPDADEGYTYYINEHGLFFPVPPPDDGDCYSANMIEEIMNRGQINRIIPLKLKAELKETDAG